MSNKLNFNQKNESGPDRIRIGDHVTLVRRGKQKKWTADYSFTDQNGNRRHSRKSLGTRNQRVAEEKARELEVKLTKGEGRPEPKLRTTIESAIEAFVTAKRVDGKSLKTLAKYESELKRLAMFLDKTFKVTSMQAVTIEQIDAYKRYRKDDQKLENYTIYNHIMNIKGFFKWCRKRKMIAENPLAEVELREPIRRRHPAATQEQLEKILARAEGYFLLLLEICGFTGLRIGEATALRPGDVDLKSGLVHVRLRADWSPKTGASEREVPIHPRLAAVLQAWVNAGRVGTNWFVPAPSYSRDSQGDQQANPDTINRNFQILADRCGYVVGRENHGLTLHSLRRFFKTFAFDSGVPKPLVDLWMGHRVKRDMDQFYYDPQKSTDWMQRLVFGDVHEGELKRLLDAELESSGR